MSTPFDGAAARRIMSTEYGRHGHIEKGSFAARAQSAAAKNMNAGKVRAKTAGLLLLPPFRAGVADG